MSISPGYLTLLQKLLVLCKFHGNKKDVGSQVTLIHGAFTQFFDPRLRSDPPGGWLQSWSQVADQIRIWSTALNDGIICNFMWMFSVLDASLISRDSDSGGTMWGAGKAMSPHGEGCPHGEILHFYWGAKWVRKICHPQWQPVDDLLDFALNQGEFFSYKPQISNYPYQKTKILSYFLQ